MSERREVPAEFVEAVRQMREAQNVGWCGTLFELIEATARVDALLAEMDREGTS